MIFFTKTCARDAERVVYQAKAIAHLRPGIHHVVMIESADLQLAVRKFCELPSHTQVVTVEDRAPYAMTIEDPYLRQQYLKLIAPALFEQDTLQLDSDMCPFTDDPFVNPQKVRWYFTKCASKAAVAGCREWNASYRHLGLGSVPNELLNSSFMLEQCGWYVPMDAAMAFNAAVCRGTGGSLRKALLQLASHGFKISEYQFFGLWAYLNSHDAYDWVEGPAPKWVHHFSSTEQLEPWMHEVLGVTGG